MRVPLTVRLRRWPGAARLAPYCSGLGSAPVQVGTGVERGEPGPVQLLGLALEALAHGSRMQIDVELPVEVIELVLEASCHQPFPLVLESLPAPVHPAHDAA